MFTNLSHWTGRKLSILLCSIIFLIFGCNKTSFHQQDETSPWKNQNNDDRHNNGIKASASMLMTWNQAAGIAVVRTNTHLLYSPLAESRLYAMTHIAIHDALNNILPVYRTYLKKGKTAQGLPDAAIAAAAHDVLLHELPGEQVFLDSQYAASLSTMPSNSLRAKGILIGQQAAMAIVANRATDGYTTSQFQITEGTVPGVYRFTPPFNGPPFNGFYLLPGWPDLKAFGMKKNSQFRTKSPTYPVNSDKYTKDYNEVKRLGCSACPDRTADQTEIALFWWESTPLGWNRIARTVGNTEKYNAWDMADFLALLNIAMADAYISVMEAKRFYFYWRPITAIHLAATDGNPDTQPDAFWQVLAPPTPPIADYPSGHACVGASAAAVMKDVVGTDRFNFSATSTTKPGATRWFHSFSQASRENCLSRIYIGFHFRHAVDEGEKQGMELGDWIAKNYLEKN